MRHCTFSSVNKVATIKYNDEDDEDEDYDEEYEDNEDHDDMMKEPTHCYTGVRLK